MAAPPPKKNARTSGEDPQFCSPGSPACLGVNMQVQPFSAYSGDLQAVPSLIRSGYPVKLFWNVQNAASCSVTSPGFSLSGTSSGSAGKPTNAITKQTTFHLHCDGVPGASPPTLDESAVVNLVPVFQGH
jgi:hypothetical protein